VYIKRHSIRFRAVFILFILLLSSLLIRLFAIHLFRASYLEAMANKQHNLFLQLDPNRGNILDRNLKPLSLNLTAYSLFAEPVRIKDKDSAIAQLVSILGLDRGFLEERLNRKKSFVWVARKLSLGTMERIKALKINGLGFIKESKRYYPNSFLAAQVIGFADLDNNGLEGLELFYNNYLKGVPGWSFVKRDARQRELLLEKYSIPPKDGYDLVLTIDATIQFIVEKELDAAFKKSNARGASVIVMDPFTGEILAMANRPSFDLNNYKDTEADSRRNRAVCDMFEPGSVFKIVTASAALSENRITETDKVFCENGQYRVANHILHDHTSHGTLTFREVIEQSSNIGTTKVAQRLGSQIIYKYEKLFGFGDLTRIDLPGEVGGMVIKPAAWSKTSIGAVPIGQEVAVTAIQLVCAISAIGNGGNGVHPYVAKAIVDKQGELIKEFKPAPSRKVIDENMANRVKSIITGVVERGTGKLAKPASFSAAGKTGTAQKVEPNGTYSQNKFFATFIGFAPADNPRIAIAVVFDEPHPSHFGGTVAAPVFAKVVENTLKYLQEQEEPKEVENAHPKKNLAELRRRSAAKIRQPTGQ
jgi:cell division protein FtsI (penicillin-binding protein 3)